MADEVSVQMDVMIIEAGIMANSVTPTDAGKALQQKIQDAADEAWSQQKPDVVLSFNPFEAGMLLGGLSRGAGNVTGDLINRTFEAVNAKMRELGIQPLNTPQNGLGGSDQEPAAGQDPLAPPQDNEPEQGDNEQSSENDDQGGEL